MADTIISANDKLSINAELSPQTVIRSDDYT